jgi:hypothetical protein
MFEKLNYFTAGVDEAAPARPDIPWHTTGDRKRLNSKK